jgi:hypothetical protein
MAIPKETHRELFVAVDTGTRDITISPPVIDMIMSQGAPLPPSANTLLFNSMNNDVMTIQTIGGLFFTVDDVQQLAVTIREQVLTGNQDPTIGGIVGGAEGRIYIDGLNNAILVWHGIETTWENPQVTYGTQPPEKGKPKDIYIRTDKNSILVWY